MAIYNNLPGQDPIQALDPIYYDNNQLTDASPPPEDEEHLFIPDVGPNGHGQHITHRKPTTLKIAILIAGVVIVAVAALAISGCLLPHSSLSIILPSAGSVVAGGLGSIGILIGLVGYVINKRMAKKCLKRVDQLAKQIASGNVHQYAGQRETYCQEIVDKKAEAEFLLKETKQFKIFIGAGVILSALTIFTLLNPLFYATPLIATVSSLSCYSGLAIVGTGVMVSAFKSIYEIEYIKPKIYREKYDLSIDAKNSVYRVYQCIRNNMNEADSFDDIAKIKDTIDEFLSEIEDTYSQNIRLLDRYVRWLNKRPPYIIKKLEKVLSNERQDEALTPEIRRQHESLLALIDETNALYKHLKQEVDQIAIDGKALTDEKLPSPEGVQDLFIKIYRTVGVMDQLKLKTSETYNVHSTLHKELRNALGITESSKVYKKRRVNKNDPDRMELLGYTA